VLDGETVLTWVNLSALACAARRADGVVVVNKYAAFLQDARLIESMSPLGHCDRAAIPGAVVVEAP
jgi:hypothetical protein